MGEMTQIRGEANREQEEVLGVVRLLFNPRWLQVFETGAVLVSFKQGHPEFEDALLSVMSEEGYELRERHGDVWGEYTFEKAVEIFD
jgi:hypothetical protein